jgi:prevent-host-death family protein
MVWKSSEAKPKLCELIRRAEADGPQTITRRGVEMVVVMSIDEYRKLTGQVDERQGPSKDAPPGGHLTASS